MCHLNPPIISELWENWVWELGGKSLAILGNYITSGKHKSKNIEELNSFVQLSSSKLIIIWNLKYWTFCFNLKWRNIKLWVVNIYCSHYLPSFSSNVNGFDNLNVPCFLTGILSESGSYSNKSKIVQYCVMLSTIPFT